MFDIKWIRDNAAAFDAALKRRGLEPLSAKLIAKDEERRKLITVLQEAQARRNAASKDIGKAKAGKDEATAQKLMAEVAALKETIAKGEDDERRIDKELTDALAVIPNMPHAEVPDGNDEKGNKQVRKVGTPKTFDFAPKQHFELGEALGLMDFESAQKISGARFVVLKGALSRLERAIASFMIDVHTAPAKDGIGGYSEYQVPLLVRDHTAYGTGNLPKFAGDLFYASSSGLSLSDAETSRMREGLKSIEKSKATIAALDFPPMQYEAVQVDRVPPQVGDPATLISIDVAKEMKHYAAQYFDLLSKHVDLASQLQGGFWLIPTAEVSLTNLVRDEILDEDKLPMRMTAWTPCFRSEAGAAGRDTRGMIRQHQFSKVELVSITTPETSLAEHERMTACAETILKRLDLPFRTMMLCTGDMGFASQKTYDIEVWLPGQDAYREISSCSVCGDFQSRRMGARYRDKTTKEVRYVHTLNGSGLAVGRTLIAVMENYQQKDGSIRIPDALRPYMGGLELIAKA